jgi:hypothetical protein
LDCHRVGLDLPSTIRRPVVLDQEPNISHLISLPEMRRKEGHQLLLLHGYLPIEHHDGLAIICSSFDSPERIYCTEKRAKYNLCDVTRILSKLYNTLC